MRKLIKIILLVFSIATSCVSLGLSLSIYKVTSTTGASLMWLPWSMKWSEIKVGSEIYEGTLIQSVTPSVIDLERVDTNGQADLELRLRLNLAQPTMIRLTRPVGRAIAVGSTLLEIGSELPKINPNKSASKKPKAKPLSQAWFRTQSFISTLNKDLDLFRKMIDLKMAKKPAILQRARGSIRIKEPRDGSVVFADEFPVELPIRWESLGEEVAQKRKVIYLWEDGKGVGEPIGTADDPVYVISITKPGSFFIGVATEDHSLASEHIILNFEK